jgi:hypothetical protein
MACLYFDWQIGHNNAYTNFLASSCYDRMSRKLLAAMMVRCGSTSVRTWAIMIEKTGPSRGYSGTAETALANAMRGCA